MSRFNILYALIICQVVLFATGCGSRKRVVYQPEIDLNSVNNAMVMLEAGEDLSRLTEKTIGIIRRGKGIKLENSHQIGEIDYIITSNFKVTYPDHLAYQGFSSNTRYGLEHTIVLYKLEGESMIETEVWSNEYWKEGEFINSDIFDELSPARFNVDIDYVDALDSVITFIGTL